MVATQSFSISRRALDVEDYFDIVRRHAGWIAGPTFCGIVASICIAFMLPNEYTSKATMEITPPQIGENMVQTTISNALNERIEQMKTELLSRASLSQIIQDPHIKLYTDEQKTVPLDDVIDKMRNNIHINIIDLPGALGRRATAFEIQFTYSNRYKAQQTVANLMDKFGESNVGTQKNSEDQLTGLVGELLNQAKADRQKASDELMKFQEANDGKLPEEAGLNLAMVNNYTEKIRGITAQIFNDEQSRATLETQKSIEKGRRSAIDDLEAQAAEASLPGSPTAKVDPELAELDANIDKLKFSLAGLKKNFSDSYPAVRTTQKALENYQDERVRVEAKLKAQAAADAAKPKDEVRKTPNDFRAAESKRGIDEKIAQIDSAEKRIDDDIARLQKDQATYTKESDDLSKKVKESTSLEADYQDLKRNQEMAENNYQELLRKQQMTFAEKKLVERRAGENLEVLDVASLPMLPTNPNRPRIIAIGVGLSMFVGLVFAAAQEARDTSLKNLKDVRAYTNLPVLCSIPLLENTMLVKRKRRLTYLGWSAAVIVGAAAVGAAVLYYLTITVPGIS